MSTDVYTADQIEPDVHLQNRMRAVFQTNARPLYYFLHRLTRGQSEMAEDLLQETMLRAWRNLADLPTDATAIRRWLFIVARNLAIDLARARLARPMEIHGVDVSWVRSPDDAFEGLLDRSRLHDALCKLTPEHRTVLVELYYRDASVTEAAKRIGIPEGTVRSRSFYALRAARGVLSGVDESRS
ncbi:sigma-70 family RNA polymerase sigma factor [Dactylosporangium sp. CA-233914]|uniref:sigma-70 family RNA polymerase sigma factor n=1 Tax=Dactylosporangium sp. CA-233914 TaxID=3239934 RepID=UPI003D8C0594